MQFFSVHTSLVGHTARHTYAHGLTIVGDRWCPNRPEWQFCHFRSARWHLRGIPQNGQRRKLDIKATGSNRTMFQWSRIPDEMPPTTTKTLKETGDARFALKYCQRQNNEKKKKSNSLSSHVRALRRQKDMFICRFIYAIMPDFFFSSPLSFATNDYKKRSN